jgi:hypothetical protein
MRPILVPNIRVLIYLVIGKDRAVLADVIYAEHAVAALADTAAHILFHRKVNLAVFESELQYFHRCEFHHNRRAAYHRYGVLQINVIFRTDISYYADAIFPLAVCFIGAKPTPPPII